MSNKSETNKKFANVTSQQSKESASLDDHLKNSEMLLLHIFTSFLKTYFGPVTKYVFKHSRIILTEASKL